MKFGLYKYKKGCFKLKTGIAVDVLSGVEGLTSSHAQFHVMLVRTQALTFMAGSTRRLGCTHVVDESPPFL